MKKILFLLIAMIMVGCTVVEDPTGPGYYGPDYYEGTVCSYHFVNDCGQAFSVREENMTTEKMYYYEHYYDRDYCGLYKFKYRDDCDNYVTYY